MMKQRELKNEREIIGEFIESRGVPYIVTYVYVIFMSEKIRLKLNKEQVILIDVWKDHGL